VSKDRNTSPLFILVAIVTTIAALYVAQAILLPIALAILLSFLLTPLADRLESWRIPRVPAVLSVVLLAFALLGGLGWIVTLQLIDLSRQLPKHRATLIQKFESLRPNSQTISEATDTLSDLRKALTKDDNADHKEKKKSAADSPLESDTPKTKSDAAESEEARLARKSAEKALETFAESGTAEEAPPDDKAVAVKVVELPPSPLSQIQDWLGPLVAPLTTAGLVVVLVLFMLLDRENQRSRLVQLFGRSRMHVTAEAMHDMSRRVGRYLRTLFLLNAGYGATVALGLWVIGVPGAIMWGVLGFSLRFLPYIGPWIAAVMPITVSIATSIGWSQPIYVVCWYIAVELISNNVVEPLVYGSMTGVSTVGVIISAIFWTWLWGPLGLILSMPMTVCLLVAARYVPQLKFLTTLLADRPPMSPGERVYQRLLAFDDREPLKIAHKHRKDSSLASFYDGVLLPALVMAEHDRHADLLNEEQAAFVLEGVEDMIEEVGGADLEGRSDKQPTAATTSVPGKQETSASRDSARILCVPLRDEADEMASRMLVQLLHNAGFQAEFSTPKSLTSEHVDRVATTEIDVVVISVVPPIRPRDSRLLWRRLRERYPDLPIVIGYWTAKGEEENLAEPFQDSNSKVVATLEDCVSVVASLAARVTNARNSA
jgi:predicted PurR-regulated permease PerM